MGDADAEVEVELELDEDVAKALAEVAELSGESAEVVVRVLLAMWVIEHGEAEQEAGGGEDG